MVSSFEGGDAEELMKPVENHKEEEVEMKSPSKTTFTRKKP